MDHPDGIGRRRGGGRLVEAAATLLACAISVATIACGDLAEDLEWVDELGCWWCSGETGCWGNDELSSCAEGCVQEVTPCAEICAANGYARSAGCDYGESGNGHCLCTDDAGCDCEPGEARCIDFRWLVVCGDDCRWEETDCWEACGVLSGEGLSGDCVPAITSGADECNCG